MVDWTNARNRRYPGSTRICCLDEPGDLAGQVEERGKAEVESPKSKVQSRRSEGESSRVVFCVGAKRSRWPFDLNAVSRIRKQLLSLDFGLPTLDFRLSPPPVLHAHNLAAWQYGVLVKIFGKPHPALVYTQHGANVHNMKLRDRIRARILACFTDEIVAVSAATAEVMAAKLWIPRKRIRVVVNGVGFSEDPESRTRNSESKEMVGIPPDALVIGSVGRLAQVKGYDRLIAAFAACEARGGRGLSEPQTKDGSPEVRPPVLLLVGDGPEREALQRQAQELGVADRVVFAGYQADPAPYLAAMDLFVLPSRSEGVSVALLEAMAAGVPVAVTDVGANREVIEDGKCGVVLPEDEGQWAGVMTAIWQDVAAARVRGEAARIRVSRHYSLATTLDAYDQLYNFK